VLPEIEPIEPVEEPDRVRLLEPIATPPGRANEELAANVALPASVAEAADPNAIVPVVAVNPDVPIEIEVEDKGVSVSVLLAPISNVMPATATELGSDTAVEVERAVPKAAILEDVGTSPVRHEDVMLQSLDG
jgi:hypothetical protein